MVDTKWDFSVKCQVLSKKKILGHKEVIEGIYYCDQFSTLKRTPYIKKK